MKKGSGVESEPIDDEDHRCGGGGRKGKDHRKSKGEKLRWTSVTSATSGW